jgi:uncharacterized membrane protein
MDVVSTMLVLALLFAGSHVGLATRPVRSRLTAALGEWGFVWLYFLVAATTFTLATTYYADHRMDGPAGLALGRIEVLRWPLVALVVVGVTSMVASFSSYARSPYSLDGRRGPIAPRGLERVTRHPFFAGMALFGTAHALLATHLVGAVLMLGLAALAVAGPWHQDRKLARLRGKEFSDYLAATSAVPFAAIASGRQRLVWRELPLASLTAGLVVALLLSRVHGEIFAHRGVWVVAATVGGALAITVATWVRDRRAHAPRDLRASRAP